MTADPSSSAAPSSIVPSPLAALTALTAAWLPVLADPTLGLDRCGLPRSLAPRVFSLLRLTDPDAPGPLSAPWIARTPLLVARPASLDRHGTAAFFPSLVDGDALRLSPLALRRLGLVPGDAVRVQAPLTDAAREEACQRMMPPADVLDPTDGLLHLTLSSDALLGLTLLTRHHERARGECPLPDDPHAPPPIGLGLTPPRELSPYQRWSRHPAWDALRQATSPADDSPEARATMTDLVRRVRGWQLARDGHLTGVVASLDEAERAHDQGLLDRHARLLVRRGATHHATTLGRLRVVAAAGDAWFASLNRELDAPALRRMLLAFCARHGPAATVAMVTRLEVLGLDHATRSGFSLCLDSFAVPTTRRALIADGHARVKEVAEQYDEGLITDGERYHKTIDVWSSVVDRVRSAQIDEFQPVPGAPLRPEQAVLLLAQRGIGTTLQQAQQVGAIQGLLSKPWGEIHERPLLHGFREGHSPHGVFLLAAAARHRRLQLDAHQRTQRSVLDLLVRALGPTRVVTHDCGSVGGLWLRPLDDWEPMASLARRLHGRTLAGSLRWDGPGEPGDLLEGELLAQVLAAKPEAVPVRSLVTCEAEGGVCAVCHGRGPGQRGWPEVGDPVGIWAAQAIAASVPEITHRNSHTHSLHLGLHDPRDWDAQHAGTFVLFTPHPVTMQAARLVSALRASDVLRSERRINVVPGNDGLLARVEGRLVLMEPADAVVIDEQGRELQRASLPPGAHVRVWVGKQVSAGDRLAAWDASRHPVLAPGAGVVRYRDLLPGLTFHDHVHELTGLSRRIVEHRGPARLVPRLEIQDANGHLYRIELDDRTDLTVLDGAQVERGTVLATTPRGLDQESSFDEMSDHDRLLTALLARRSKRPALLSELDGIVSFKPHPRCSDGIGCFHASEGSPIRVTPLDEEGSPQEHLARTYRPPTGGWMNLCNGDRVKAGGFLAMGDVSPADLLPIRGLPFAASAWLDQLQRICEKDGAALPSPHLELAVRELLAFVRITAPGDSEMAAGTVLRRARFWRENAACEARGGRPARAEPCVVGLARGPSIR